MIATTFQVRTLWITERQVVVVVVVVVVIVVVLGFPLHDRGVHLVIGLQRRCGEGSNKGI
jgi:hypothetical protein